MLASAIHQSCIAGESNYVVKRSMEKL